MTSSITRSDWLTDCKRIPHGWQSTHCTILDLRVCVCKSSCANPFLDMLVVYKHYHINEPHFTRNWRHCQLKIIHIADLLCCMLALNTIMIWAVHRYRPAQTLIGGIGVFPVIKMPVICQVRMYYGQSVKLNMLESRMVREVHGHILFAFVSMHVVNKNLNTWWWPYTGQYRSISLNLCYWHSSLYE